LRRETSALLEFNASSWDGSTFFGAGPICAGPAAGISGNDCTASLYVTFCVFMGLSRLGMLDNRLKQYWFDAM
jgi:hypothetical protein